MNVGISKDEFLSRESEVKNIFKIHSFLKNINFCDSNFLKTFFNVKVLFQKNALKNLFKKKKKKNQHIQKFFSSVRF